MTAATAAMGAVLRAGRYNYAQETEFHLGIETALRQAGYNPVPEVHITGGRIDFLVDRVGVEVKIKGTRDALHRQLLRYAASPRVDELLVVTTVWAHRSLPREVGGKPLDVVLIGGAV